MHYFKASRVWRLAIAGLALAAVSCGGGDETDTATLDPVETPTTIEIVGTTQQPAAVVTSTPIPTSTPLPTPTPPPRTTSLEYTVASGDVLGLLAEEYDVSLSSLLAANPGVAPETLQVGQVITIPAPDGTISGDVTLTVPTPTSSAPRPTATPIVRLDRADGVAEQYIVVSGDRASNIAFAHSVSVDAIQGANGLVNVDSLWIGQCLIIPAKGSTTSGRIDPSEALCPNGTASNDPAGATPVPTVDVTPVPTVDPNVTPTATPTPDPNATPIPTPTPTVDPLVTPTVTPTAGPTATATPTPTVDPLVTPTATPTVDPAAPDLTQYGDNYLEWDTTTDGQAFAANCVSQGGTLEGILENICDLPG